MSTGTGMHVPAPTHSHVHTVLLILLASPFLSILAYTQVQALSYSPYLMLKLILHTALAAGCITAIVSIMVTGT